MSVRVIKKNLADLFFLKSLGDHTTKWKRKKKYDRKSSKEREQMCPIKKSNSLLLPIIYYYIIQHIMWPREQLSIMYYSHYTKLVCWLILSVY